jgi:hypothetical protein
MSVRTAFLDGLTRVRRAPWLVTGVWLSTLAVALPLAEVLRQQIATHLGASLWAASVARGVNYDWWNEFLAQSAGLGQTFVPAILGFAAVLKNVSGVADAHRVTTLMAGILALQIAVSLFLAGGLIDRLARGRTVGAGAFFAACGVYAGRLARLFAVAAVVYWLLFAKLHSWLFETWYPRFTHDLTVERMAFAYRAGLYLVFGVLVACVNVVFDYAKIRAVVEDRRSMLGALGAALRFVARHPAQVAALYALNMLAFLIVALFYLAAAPGADAGLLALFIGQVYIVLRVAVRLQFAASQIAFFQSGLAHAGYTAAPVPVWPDSPAAEVIRP